MCPFVLVRGRCAAVAEICQWAPLALCGDGRRVCANIPNWVLMANRLRRIRASKWDTRTNCTKIGAVRMRALDWDGDR